MCYVFFIQSKVGKCHLKTFKLSQYSINLVLVASSVLELLDLGRVILSLPCHCFHGPSPPTILGIVSPGFSRRAPSPGSHAFFVVCSLIWVVPILQGLPKKGFIENKTF